MDNLPNELVYNILKKLKQKELLKCAMVCKRFKDIIESYSLINKLVIQDEVCDSSLPVFNRKYTKVIIRDNNDVNILKALQTTGDSILEVKFDQHNSSLESITKTLNYLPNVKVITFYYVRIEDDEEVVKDLVQPISHTIDFHFLESDPLIFKVLTNLSAKSIELRLYGDSPYYNFENFMPFMAKQKELKSFRLSGIFESNLMYGYVPKGDYRLTEFEISNCDLEEWIYLETYLNDHVDSLEKLSFRDLRSWDPSVIVKACNNLKRLEILEDMSINDIDSDITSVKELSVENPSLSITKFTNLKKLFMQNATAEVNRAIIGSNIENLTVRFGTVEGIQCEKLTKLRLMNIDGPLTEEFFRNHPKIVDLKLENHFLLTDALLETIVRYLQNLKVLTIYGMNDLSSRAFEIIKTHCKNLKVLDTKIWSQRYKIADWKCLFESNNGIEIYTETFNF
ncbi:unnamed protein product [Chironomus riparius]|uniref:F-box domain-containing protein n=1 Tax=Chironomus riparius TaxID=315576 RepID=A0A9N9WQU0_9DIPT|nr:unnamed protein product [Chironomus riparius]